MGATGQARTPRAYSLRTLNKIHAACHEYVPKILRNRGIKSDAIAESISGILSTENSVDIRCKEIVRNWLFDHPEVAYCDDEYWALRKVAV